MNNFKGGSFKGKGGSRFGGKNKYNGNRNNSGQNRQRRSESSQSELFSATCSECRKNCDVPFKPSNDKPVYCSACFGMKKSANESRGYDTGKNWSEKDSFPSQSNHTKLPREQRSPRHDPSRGRNDDGITEIKRQISGLETKLNKILELINPPLPSPKKTIETNENEKSEVPSKEILKKKSETIKKIRKVSPTKKVAKKATKTIAKKTIKKVASKVSSKKVAKKVSK